MACTGCEDIRRGRQGFEDFYVTQGTCMYVMYTAAINNRLVKTMTNECCLFQ